MEKQEINNKLSQLSEKPFDYKFNEEELKFIIQHSDIKDARAKYCTWKQKRINNCYILFMLDFMPFRVRKTGFDNSLEVVATRKLTYDEKLEQAQNYGCRNRITQAWHYKYVEHLIQEDEKYSIQTPIEFIKHCKTKGYSNPQFMNQEQLKLEL